LLFDDNGDQRADRRESLVRLKTPGDYPHNGLAGFAFDPRGRLVFGLGENLGAEYEVMSPDVSLGGGGEGGNVYRVGLDGGGLVQLATGFWNPHASCFDAFGRLFTVDNDPDSRPPCRLLHIIPGGDYGYRFRNGRKGLHPFTSWNGEIPGTLPMTAGTGEAPSGVVAYESDNWPSEYIGDLLATSWGDHRIDRFRLKPSGASFTSLPEPVIVGGDDFRPVGLACAPDGSLFCTDWVLADYNLHGRGRIWRIAAKAKREAPVVDAMKVPDRPVDELAGLLQSPRIEIRRAAARALAASDDGLARLEQIVGHEKSPPKALVEAGWAAIGKSERVVEQLAARQDAVAAAVDRHLDDYSYDPADQSSLTGPAKSAAAAIADERSMASASPEYVMAAYSRLATTKLMQFGRAPLDDPFVFSTVVSRLASPHQRERRPIRANLLDAKLLPLRLRQAFALSTLDDRSMLEAALRDRDNLIRRAAVQYAAEHRLIDLRPTIEKLLDDDRLTSDLFLATITALAMLDGAEAAEIDKTPAGKYVLPIARDASKPERIRALALRLVSPDEPALDEKLLREMLGAGGDLRRESIHSLVSSSLPLAAKLLREAAANDQLEVELRADAVAGLASTARSEAPGGPTRTLLLNRLDDASPPVALEALRSLRGVAAVDKAVRERVTASTAVKTEQAEQIAMALSESGANPSRPIEEWKAALGDASKTGDAKAGRRTFFHSASAGCYKCHTVGGRGGPVGPDLTFIGRSASRQRLIDSILAPSAEIAPQFVSWSFETADGRVHQGLIVHENEGRTIIGDVDGKTTEIATAQLTQRIPQKISLMPQNIVDKLTVQEFRDLIAFLESLK
jgi:putative heme-binding domain-containing protein